MNGRRKEGQHVHPGVGQAVTPPIAHALERQLCALVAAETAVSTAGVTWPPRTAPRSRTTRTSGQAASGILGQADGKRPRGDVSTPRCPDGRDILV